MQFRRHTAYDRYLTVFGYRADFESMRYPDVDDPERDDKRLGYLTSTVVNTLCYV